MKLTSSDIHDAKQLIAGSKVMVCQLEVPQETTLEALYLAKQNNGNTHQWVMILIVVHIL